MDGATAWGNGDGADWDGAAWAEADGAGWAEAEGAAVGDAEGAGWLMAGGGAADVPPSARGPVIRPRAAGMRSDSAHEVCCLEGRRLLDAATLKIDKAASVPA